MERFQRQLGFYGCTVPSFEQCTLARFLEEGHFEKHINRMRRSYRSCRNRVVRILEESPLAGKIRILEQDAGLHFILRCDTKLSDEALVRAWEQAGIRVRSLGQYYHGPIPAWAEHCLVINYSALTEESMERLEKALAMGLEI